jgi:murein DD-endopeptidase MepM/ murein hydrolase activator NlpD
MKTLALILCCCLPLKHLSLTSPFGYRIHPITSQYRFHSGVDLRAHHDTVYAVFDGTASVGYDDKLGIFIRISDRKSPVQYNERLGAYIAVHDSSLTCIYGHLSILLIGAGPVVCNQPIAVTGATGQVTGEHIHFSIKFKGRYLDPLKFLYQLNLNPYPHE